MNILRPVSPRRVALVFDRPYVDAHPCFREMVCQFARCGWNVDLFMTHSPSHPIPVFDSNRVRIFRMQKTRVGLLNVLSRLVLPGRYTIVVATPQWPLHWAVWAKDWGRFRVVCLSDEIYLQEETETPVQRKWKRREIRAHQLADFTVSLSETRMSLVAQENCLRSNHPYAVIPNAPSGEAYRSTSCYYRERFLVPPERGILVHSGTLGWRLAAQLAGLAEHWSEPWTVVFQGRFKGANRQGVSGRSVYYEERVFPGKQMHEITSSADIGLALYDRTHPVERRNGETPGKLGLYLSCALPVICGNIDSLRWVSEEKCGEWVEDLAEIPRAAERIKANYQQYTKNAARVFNERFEYSSRFDGFLFKLQCVLETQQTTGRGTGRMSEIPSD